MKRRKCEEGKWEEPAATSFVDIIFQLLIFFMLSLKFKSNEGYLVTYLPQEKGLFATKNNPLNVPELRIFICADSKGWTTHGESAKAMMWHIGHKQCGNWPTHCQKCHDLVLEQLQMSGNAEIGDITIVQVAQDEKVNQPASCVRYPLYRTLSTVMKGKNEETRADAGREDQNDKTYDMIAMEVEKLLSTGRYRHPAPKTKEEAERLGIVKLDCDISVPSEHYIGIINALYKRGLHKKSSIEFAGNPKWAYLFKNAQQLLKGS